MSRLASDQNATHWSRITDRSLAVAAHLLGWWKIRHIGSMPFPGVNNFQALPSPSRQQPPVRFNGTPKLVYVISEHFPESARLQEIALHIDNDERALRRLEVISVRFCFDAGCQFAVHEGFLYSDMGVGDVFVSTARARVALPCVRN